MKTITKISLTAICFMACSLFTSLHAQNEDTAQTSFGIRMAGVTAGWYNPSMDYWNDTYFKDNGWENSFSGAAYYGAFIEVNVIKDLRARVGYNYWKETVKSGEIPIGGYTGSEKLAVTLSTLSIDVLYDLNLLTFWGCKPYAGIGGNFVFVQAELTRTITSLPDEEIKKQGQDYTASLIIGIERPILRHLTTGIEFNYILGKYIQKVIDVYGVTQEKDVLLSGPKIGIKISYMF